MSEPSFYGERSEPRRNDTRLKIATKQLGALQSRIGADEANNPRRTDGLRRIKTKILNAWRNL